MLQASKMLQDKVAIVTGASRGIGRAIALNLAGHGCRVLATARDEMKLAEVVAEIQRGGGTAASLALDLKEPQAAARVAAKAIELFGAIDIVVNNAGSTKRGAFTALSELDWQDGFALKFFGAVRLIRAAWPHLKARRGSILNIAGVGGRTPGREFAIGGSVNAALLSLTKALADAGIADGIQVNAVNPGPVRTDRLTVRMDAFAKEHGVSAAEAEIQMVESAAISRFGEPGDIAALVAFVVSPQGSLLQGALIDIDGGSTKTI